MKNKNYIAYGLPYMGSKNAIAEEIINILPSAEYFVDLFGGGGALTHCAFLSGKYQKFIYNELDTEVYTAFKLASNGELPDEAPKWLSHEEFNIVRKGFYPLKLLYTFGTQFKGDYFCSPKREITYKNMYEYVTEGKVDGILNDELFKKYGFEFDRNILLEKMKVDMDSRITFIRAYIKKQFDVLKHYITDKDDYNILKDVRCFELLTRYNRLKKLGVMKGAVEYFNGSYENVTIPDNSVVICDIPYRDTASYQEDENSFDYEKFYDFCRNKNHLVFINEYSMPEDFYIVKYIAKTQILSSKHNGQKTYKEKLFCNKVYKPNSIMDELF